MRNISLVYVHIGDNLPEYLFDSLYQTLLVNLYKTKIYIIVSDNLVETLERGIRCFNLNDYTKRGFNFQNVINIVPISLLDMVSVNDNGFNSYKNLINTKFANMSIFRNGFWISTTARFYYLRIFMQTFNIKNVFHIENDIMIYDNFHNVYEYICKNCIVDEIDKICMIQDAPDRVIPSLLYFPSYIEVMNLTQFITNELETSSEFVNDMNILGKYQDKINLPIMPYNKQTEIIFDGAALGQYLGGVDYRNLPEQNDMNTVNNPSRGFVNETAIIKASDYEFLKLKTELDDLQVPIRIPILKSVNLHKIFNLHIHSKQLYQFSSVSDLLFDDIISGDRVAGLCDFVLLTKEIYAFHKNLDKHAKDVIIIKDFGNVNINLLKAYFKQCCKVSNKNVVKLFIYTHILDDFQKYIFPYLDASIGYVIYCHNSDHSVTDAHKSILTSSYVKKVYAQNIDTTIDSDKISLLPIGIANSMWPHGDILQLYKVISKVYRNKKVNPIYVNINPNTYLYRKNILDKIKEKGKLTISTGKPYVNYLEELASHRFCLCLRGNGIDTHRFWESLYLGVIPVIINNNTTKCKNFVKYLRKLEIPFYEICDDDLDVLFNKYTDDFFNENLYKYIIKKSGSSIYNLDALKVKYYDYDYDSLE